jgi:hypothetical protein
MAVLDAAGVVAGVVRSEGPGDRMGEAEAVAGSDVSSEVAPGDVVVVERDGPLE